MRIPIKYHADIIPITATERGDWIDLRAAEDVDMKAGEFKLISLGISMQLPVDYEALVIPRSSTYKNFGLLQANHIGLIDNSYCGNDDVWKFAALAMRDTRISKNDRICQFRIQRKMPELEFDTVDHLDGQNRGGFGSSGRC